MCRCQHYGAGRGWQNAITVEAASSSWIAAASSTSNAVAYAASPIAIDHDTHREEERAVEDTTSDSMAATALSTVAVEEVAVTFSGLMNPFAEEAAAAKLFAMEIARLTVEATKVEGDWGSWRGEKYG